MTRVRRHGLGCLVVALGLGVTLATAQTTAPTTAPAPTAPAASTPAAPATTAPAAAPATTTNAAPLPRLVNPGFESTAKGPTLQSPEGWLAFQHAGPPSYEFARDIVERHSGKASMRMWNTGPEPYGALSQHLAVTPGQVGRVARFSGWMKSSAATGEGPALILLAKAGESILANNFTATPKPLGTADWTRHVVTLTIPPRTNRIEVGVMLQGPGTVWFDDAEFEFVAP